MVIFYIIPLLFMLIEEKNISKQNVIPFAGLIFTQLLLPVWDVENMGISIVSARFQICTYTLLIYILVVIGSEIKALNKSKALNK